MAKKPGTALINWQEEMARQAEIAKAQEASAAGGQFFSIRGATLSFNNTPVPGNTMGVVVLDSIFENLYYAGKFDPEVIVPPDCFAFGRDKPDDMAPHEIAAHKQSDKCSDCPMNAWGTADQGRGKACRNTRRLALLPAGTFGKNGQFQMIKEPEHYLKTQAAFFKLPVTSVRGWSQYVSTLANTLLRPPHGVVTRISVFSDPKTQVRVEVEPIEKLPDGVMAAIMQRHAEIQKVIAFPYQPMAEQKAPARKPAAAKPKAAAKKKR